MPSVQEGAAGRSRNCVKLEGEGKAIVSWVIGLWDNGLKATIQQNIKISSTFRKFSRDVPAVSGKRFNIVFLSDGGAIVIA